MVPNRDSQLCESGLKPPAGSSAAERDGSGQCSHFSSTEKLIMAERSLSSSIFLFLSGGVALKLT